MISRFVEGKGKVKKISLHKQRNISGGCTDDKNFWFKVGCAIAKLVEYSEGNLERGPRNGYYF